MHAAGAERSRMFVCAADHKPGDHRMAVTARTGSVPAAGILIMGIMKDPNDSFVDSRDFARIAKSIRFIATHFREQPRLATIADHAGLSEFHFNRLFRRWAGVTPKQYLAYVTGREARGEIVNQSSVLDAAYAVGLSGPGRLHDLIVTLDAVTPGELKALGRGITLHYGFSETPFGDALLASTSRGLSHLAFVDSGEREKALSELRAQWRNADLVPDDAQARAIANQIWGATAAARVDNAGPALKLHVAGTNFQLKVWQALLDLGAHSRTTYSDVAAAIGEKSSARAVGNAVSANPVGWLIPCHNVLRRDGGLGGYHWGEDRKRAILAWDSLRNETLVPEERVNGGVRA
jgi:AraC family transcriptional regulator, regulatory protein of adaptative response / methylated-DNA-[protein]-cysteine methyltransferase